MLFVYFLRRKNHRKSHSPGGQRNRSVFIIFNAHWIIYRRFLFILPLLYSSKFIIHFRWWWSFENRFLKPINSFDWITEEKKKKNKNFFCHSDQMDSSLIREKRFNLMSFNNTQSLTCLMFLFEKKFIRTVFPVIIRWCLMCGHSINTKNTILNYT